MSALGALRVIVVACRVVSRRQVMARGQWREREDA